MKNDDDFIHLPELYIKLGTLKKYLQKTYKLNINPMKNSDQNVNWSDLNKNLNAGYDDEKMAMISCDIIHEYAVKLDKVVKEDTELEEWVKSKIAKTEQMMASVKHALIGIEKYDHGGELFKQQLLHIGKYAQAIIEVLQDGTELMSWMESNLAVCADHMDNVYHHLDYKMGNRAKDLDKMKNGGGVSETPIAMMREVTGKSVGTVPVSEKIYSSQVNDFVNYVYEVYAEQGYTKAQVKTAVNKYIKDLGKEFTYGGGDSLDRERVYEYLLNPNLKGIKNPMFANGGGVDDINAKREKLIDFYLDNESSYELENFYGVSEDLAINAGTPEGNRIKELRDAVVKYQKLDNNTIVIEKYDIEFNEYANGGGVDENDEYELKVKPIKEEYRDSFLTYWTIEYRKKGYKKPLFSNPFKKSEADWTPLVPKEDEFSIFLNEHCISISIGEYQEAGGNQKVEEEIAKNLNDKYGIIDAENQRAYWTWPYNEKTKEYRLRIFNLYSKKELAESIAKLLSSNNDKLLKEVLRRKQEILQEEKEEKEAQENYKKPSYFANGGGIGKEYKLRAEGINDFINFLGTCYFAIKWFKVEIHPSTPDVTVTFSTNLSLKQIKENLELVQDSYVMLNTLKPVNQYTGERMADGGGIGSEIGIIKLHEKYGDIIYVNPQFIVHMNTQSQINSDKIITQIGLLRGQGMFEVKETPEEIIELIKSAGANKMANGGNVGRDAMFRSQEPHEQRYDRKREYKEYKKEGWLANDWFDNGGGVGYFKSGYTLKGRKGKYWIDDVEGRVTKDRYFEKEEDAIAEIDLLSRFKKLKNEQRVKGPSMENLMEADRYYAEGGGVENDPLKKKGDIVTDGNNFYEVLREYTAYNSGADQYARENEGASLPAGLEYGYAYTALKLRNLETGYESSGPYSDYEKIKREDIEGLKQAKLVKDADDKIKEQKRKAEQDAERVIWQAKMEEAERVRNLSKGDIELAKELISDWENSIDEIDYNFNHHNELILEVNYTYNKYLGETEPSEEYFITFKVEIEQTASGWYDPGDRWTPGYGEDAQYKFSLDRVYIEKNGVQVYEGKVEFVELFDKSVLPKIDNWEALNEDVDKEYTERQSSY